MIRILILMLAVLSEVTILSAQQTGKTPEQMTDKEREEIVAKKYAQEQASRIAQQRSDAFDYYKEQLQNKNQVKELTFSSFPDNKLPGKISEFQKLEVLRIENSRYIDLYYLFNDLSLIGSLRELHINSCKLRQLPGNIGLLKSLKHLDLTDNELQKLPDSLKQCNQIESVNLRRNPYLNDSAALAVLAALPELKDLNLSAGGYFGISPLLGQLKNLKNLDLSANGIESLPAAVNGLTQLEYLNLSRNEKINPGKLTAVLSAVPRLKTLLLNECGINSITFGNIGFKELRALHLKGNAIQEFPAGLAQLTELDSLDLGLVQLGYKSNSIASVTPELNKLQKLTYLNLSGNQLSGFPEVLLNCKSLQTLDLSYNSISQLPDSVSELQNLRILKLNQCGLNALPEGICKLSQLKAIEAEGFFFTGREGKLKALPEGIGKLNQLERLILKDNLIEKLPESTSGLSQLKEIDLRGNLLTQLPESFGKCSSLENINLKGNEIGRLPESFGSLIKLSELNLAMNKGFDYAYNKPLISKLKSLKFLDLSYNNITKEEIEILREEMSDCKIANWDFWKNSMTEEEKK